MCDAPRWAKELERGLSLNNSIEINILLNSKKVTGFCTVYLICLK